MGSEEYGASQTTRSPSPFFLTPQSQSLFFSTPNSVGESSARERENGQRYRDKA